MPAHAYAMATVLPCDICVPIPVTSKQSAEAIAAAWRQKNKRRKMRENQHQQT